jgi:hypothetical protein
MDPDLSNSRREILFPVVMLIAKVGDFSNQNGHPT